MFPLFLAEFQVYGCLYSLKQYLGHPWSWVQCCYSVTPEGKLYFSVIQPLYLILSLYQNLLNIYFGHPNFLTSFDSE